MRNNDKIIYGVHSVLAILKQQPENVCELMVASGRDDKRITDIIKLAADIGIKPQYYERKQLDSMFAEMNHQGVIVKLAKIKSFAENDLIELLDSLQEAPFLLFLDGVQDPHNLGACLRTANAAGVHAVIAPRDSAVGLTPVTRKVASGAAEVTPFIQVTNLVRTMQTLKDRGIWFYGADGDAKDNIYATKLTGSIALVMGAEGEGLRRLTRENCDFLMNIPMFGSVESLNVSVATAICIYEVVRQRV
ncbi:MAG: 23S rRNA (guanosine(2251)-2'-O)-methyltransferase RlmB [Gammaproteobacteria bacterium]|nr:23S rRNA (guanosine(2251)-2'-O)-methyltransferase RlmB [Gammaproteobacteria bacterium]